MDGDKVRKMFLYSRMILKSKNKKNCLYEKTGKMVFILADTFWHIIQCVFCLLLTERGTLTLER